MDDGWWMIDDGRWPMSDGGRTMDHGWWGDGSWAILVLLLLLMMKPPGARPWCNCKSKRSKPMYHWDSPSGHNLAELGPELLELKQFGGKSPMSGQSCSKSVQN